MKSGSKQRDMQAAVNSQPMKRIESIKERMKMNENSLECDYINLAPDVQYLLQRLEIAQKALEVAVKRMESDDHVTYNGTEFVPTYESSEEYIFIKRALDKLKE